MSRQVFLPLALAALGACASHLRAPVESIVELPDGEASCVPLRFTELVGQETFLIACDSGREYRGDVTASPIRWERTGERPASVPSRAIFAPRGAYWIEVSSDKRTLWRVDLLSGEKHLIKDKVEEIIEPWISEDGRYVVYVARLDVAGPFDLLYSDVENHQSGHFLRSKERISNPSLSGDARRLTWDRGQNAWAMDIRLRPAPCCGPMTSLLDTAADRMPVGGGAPADEAAVWSPEFEGFVKVLTREGRDSLYFVTSGPAAARKTSLCSRPLTPPSRERLHDVRLSRGSAYLAYARGRQILVAPFSGASAPCEGSPLGVEWKQ